MLAWGGRAEDGGREREQRESEDRASHGLGMRLRGWGEGRRGARAVACEGFRSPPLAVPQPRRRRAHGDVVVRRPEPPARHHDIELGGHLRKFRRDLAEAVGDDGD